MAKIRINPLSSKEKDFPHESGETLSSIFERFLETLPIKDEKIIEYYTILLDGVEIDKELWPNTTPGDSNVLIAIKPAGGDDAPLFKQIVITAITIAAIALVPEGSSYWVYAAVGASASIGSTLLINALIPPPPIDMGGLGALDYTPESSQSYLVSGQSNTIKPYGVVPKVFGTHRMFPTIAATPYISLEVAPKDSDQPGNTVQYFHCIYDFGYGPGSIYDVKIGDTDFSEFESSAYRIVDLNKPTFPQGLWDYESYKTFTMYSGDVTQTTVGANINSNREDPGTIEEEYQVIRNAADTGDGDAQEISLIFACPRGLTTYGTNGLRDVRNIELNVEFAEVGTENWRSFNDLAYVTSFKTVGDFVNGSTTFGSVRLTETGMTKITTVPSSRYEYVADLGLNDIPTLGYPDQLTVVQEIYGYPAGTTTFRSLKPVTIGSFISIGDGTPVGKVLTRTFSGGEYIHTMSAGFPKPVHISLRYYWKWSHDDGGGGP